MFSLILNASLSFNQHLRLFFFPSVIHFVRCFAQNYLKRRMIQSLPLRHVLQAFARTSGTPFQGLDSRNHKSVRVNILITLYYASPIYNLQTAKHELEPLKFAYSHNKLGLNNLLPYTYINVIKPISLEVVKTYLRVQSVSKVYT